ncbi:phosphatidylinositol-specific phospholipase C [Aspergillus clavatus NRRL 1]|uniref:Phosphatidylinositol phospholipase C n=1 Tax=Aspergillus clavatus (strain ATCC 1007 / CBS 513.65 / DSM 816 / NCTC 3887 / NRRL 1 / QM 1276 / 107) TaxID=344612 RepID=A1CIC6_ASPCL|nr:phosphatidylinositol phospholipase C [Aspergillus clavatus NRRL 1]EAW10631.1 phosphatidylinositol phospholipase C [Aspergillus clavatus NRRL 1]
MVAEHLTIRNLTSTPITLKRIERFHPHKDPHDDMQFLARNFTRILNNVTRTNTAVAAITDDNQLFASEEVDIHVEPFKAVQTELRAFMNSDKERLRWVIEAEGERHQIQTPVPTTESATMRALCDKPRFGFTGIYLTAASHLTIYSSANLHAWMKELNDNTLLSSLSIPGTHNSPTCHVAAPSVRCQAVGPREQLQNGVRFFDIRVQPQYPEDPSKDELALVHSVFPISLTGHKYFRDLMREVNEFLDNNPSETLIISLKREGPGNHTDEQLSRILRDHYMRPGSRWYTEPKIPTLGEVRGKVVLLRRFNIIEELKEEHNGRGWGINGSDWADNTPNATCNGGPICIQDFYEVLETSNIDLKIQYVAEHCDRSSGHCYPFGALPDPDASSAHPFYVNFLSASNFWKVGTWPEKIAAKLNPATVDYLCRRHSEKEDGDWSTGILVTDWVGHEGDWDLVRCIVGMNARLKLRQMRLEQERSDDSA